jgi:hypothetical protein
MGNEATYTVDLNHARDGVIILFFLLFQMSEGA